MSTHIANKSGYWSFSIQWWFEQQFLNFRYFEVSAATGENVIKMYDALIASILSKR